MWVRDWTSGLVGRGRDFRLGGGTSASVGEGAVIAWGGERERDFRFEGRDIRFGRGAWLLPVVWRDFRL